MAVTQKKNRKSAAPVTSVSHTQQMLSSLESGIHRSAAPKKRHAGNRLEDYINFLRALASPERLNIIEALEGRPMCTSDIEHQFYMEQSTASHHLTTLLKANIVHSHKEGRRVFYHVNAPYLRKYYSQFVRTLENIPKFKGKVEYKTK